MTRDRGIIIYRLLFVLCSRKTGRAPDVTEGAHKRNPSRNKKSFDESREEVGTGSTIFRSFIRRVRLFLPFPYTLFTFFVSLSRALLLFSLFLVRGVFFFLSSSLLGVRFVSLHGVHELHDFKSLSRSFHYLRFFFRVKIRSDFLPLWPRRLFIELLRLFLLRWSLYC